MRVPCGRRRRRASPSQYQRAARLVAVRQSGAPGSPKGEPPKACCTCRRAFLQRNFTVGTAMPKSAAASACGIAWLPQQVEHLSRAAGRNRRIVFSFADSNE